MMGQIFHVRCSDDVHSVHIVTMLNKVLINMSKTKEIVFRHPSIKHFLSPAPISDVAQVLNYWV